MLLLVVVLLPMTPLHMCMRIWGVWKLTGVQAVTLLKWTIAACFRVHACTSVGCAPSSIRDSAKGLSTICSKS